VCNISVVFLDNVVVSCADYGSRLFELQFLIFESFRTLTFLLVVIGLMILSFERDCGGDARLVIFTRRVRCMTMKDVDNPVFGSSGFSLLFQTKFF